MIPAPSGLLPTRLLTWLRLENRVIGYKEATTILYTLLVREDFVLELASLQQLFVDELKDLYSAENQILKALPKMAKAADSRQLQQAFREHLKQTEGHVKRLRRIFDSLGKPPTGKKCKGMEGLLSEGAELMEEDAAPAVMDAGLISAAQRVEHYEIAAYGTVRTYAQLLENREAFGLLQETLDEEKQTDVKLSELADSINVEAEAPAQREQIRASNGRLRGSTGKRKTSRR